MNLVILKTNISGEKLSIAKPILDNHKSISAWSIDVEDIDNVLRIETKEHISDQLNDQLDG